MSAVLFVALLLAATAAAAVTVRRQLIRERRRAELRAHMERMTASFRAIGEVIGRELIPAMQAAGRAAAAFAAVLQTRETPKCPE